MSYIVLLILSTIAIGFGVLILIEKNPVYNVSLLILTLISTAGIYAILNSPFIASIQLLVYAGAGVVLIIFVMMFYKYEKESKRKFKEYGLVFFAALLILLDLILISPIYSSNIKIAKTSTAELSKILLKSNTLPFELITILIFVGIIGAITLGRNND